MAGTPESASIGLLRTVVLGLVLIAVLLLVVLAPGLFGLEATSWWVTVAIGVAAGAGVVIYGYVRRDKDDPDPASPEH